MSRRVSPDVIRAEVELVEQRTLELQAAVQEALDARDMAAGAIELSLKKALTAGRLLRRERAEKDHGDWGRYLEANVPSISHETARKWMKLAEFAERNSLETASTIKQAYILAGILPEADPSQGGGKGGGGSSGDFLTHLEKAKEAILADLKTRPLEERSPEDKLVLRERLTPFVRLYEALDAE